MPGRDQRMDTWSEPVEERAPMESRDQRTCTYTDPCMYMERRDHDMPATSSARPLSEIR